MKLHSIETNCELDIVTAKHLARPGSPRMFVFGVTVLMRQARVKLLIRGEGWESESKALDETLADIEQKLLFTKRFSDVRNTNMNSLLQGVAPQERDSYLTWLSRVMEYDDWLFEPISTSINKLASKKCVEADMVHSGGIH